MPRRFSLATVLRMVPNGLLRQWFELHGAEEFDPDWDRLGEREVDPMLDFLTDLPPARSAELEKEAERS